MAPNSNTLFAKICEDGKLGRGFQSPVDCLNSYESECEVAVFRRQFDAKVERTERIIVTRKRSKAKRKNR